MKIRFRTVALLFLFTAMFEASALPKGRSSFQPKDGFVPNEETAIAIAEAILKPIYGAQQVESERPWHVKFLNGVWWVGGTLAKGKVGGVAEIRIAKKDARVLSVKHGE
jgi:hypothetical protein